MSINDNQRQIMQKFFKCGDFSYIKNRIWNNIKEQWYKTVDFNYNLVYKNNNKRSRQRNIIWFNLPFSQAVWANIGKQFLDLLDKHFPQNNQLHKTFNRNTVKVSYSCTPNVGSIIKSHNRKLTNAESKQTKYCNCKKKQEFPF